MGESALDESGIAVPVYSFDQKSGARPVDGVFAELVSRSRESSSGSENSFGFRNNQWRSSVLSSRGVLRMTGGGGGGSNGASGSGVLKSILRTCGSGKLLDSLDGAARLAAGLENRMGSPAFTSTTAKYASVMAMTPHADHRC